jgi:flagellar protein FliO/FliZ
VQIFGSNAPAAIQYLLAFVIILAVLAAVAAGLRRITGGRSRVSLNGGSVRHRQQRLGVVDVVDIDSQRQLLLLRRDNIEHLVLIGGPNDLLVESGIGRLHYRVSGPPPAPPQSQPQPQPQPQPLAVEETPPVVDLPPRGPVARDPFAADADRKPDAAGERAARVQEGSPVAARDGFASRPLTTPSPASFPPPPSAPGPLAADLSRVPDTPPADEAVPAPTARGGDRLAGRPASEESERGPIGHITAVARQLEEALKRPFSAVRPSAAAGVDVDAGLTARDAGDADTNLPEVKKAPEGLSASAPATAGETASSVPVFPFEPRPRPDAHKPAAFPPPPPPVASMGVPPAFASRGVTDAPKPPVPNLPPIRETAVRSEPLSDARSPLAPVVPPPPAAPSAAAFDEPVAPPPAEVPPPVPPRPADSDAAPAKPAAPSWTSTPAAPSLDLSSLENIEAEFARLLGRSPTKKDN